MNTTIRNTIAAAAVICSVAVAAPIVSANAPVPAPASDHLQEAGAPSLYVPIVSYRALDTRTDGVGPIRNLPDNEGVDFGGDTIRFSPIFTPQDEQAIPLEAIGITYNVTVVQTKGPGFLVVDRSNFASGGSTINWVGDNEKIANGGSVLFGPENDGGGDQAIQITVGGQEGSEAQVLLDVTGYYLPAAP